MIVKDLLTKTDEDLTGMLNGIGHEPIEWTPVILAELTRRSIVRLLEASKFLQESSRRLERLTIGLIVLTFILAVLAVPPAIEIVLRRNAPIQESSASPSVRTTPPALVPAPQPDRPDLSGLNDEDRLFLGASAYRRRFTIGQVPEFQTKQPRVGQRFEVMGKQYVVSHIFRDGSIAADE